jgi:hypothetical protein
MPRRQADIVFVVDTSSSMEPCVEGLVSQIGAFLDVLSNDRNNEWDVRIEFVAHKDSAAEDRDAGIDKDFRRRVTSRGGQYDNVDLRFSLFWDDYNDLDLSVTTPSGERIYYSHRKSHCGGELDVDCNFVAPYTDDAAENIRWTTGTAQHGTYELLVHYYSMHEHPESAFTLEILNNGHLSTYTDTVGLDQDSEWYIDVDYPATSGNVEVHQPTRTELERFQFSTVRHKDALVSLYKDKSQDFFTKDVEAFRRSLAEVSVDENETPLLALDCAMDLPWRDEATTNRIVVLFTDEPVAGGNRYDQSVSLISDIIRKLRMSKIFLYMVAPDCPEFDKLSQYEKCEYEPVAEGDGLGSVDFGKVLRQIAKSISMSQTGLATPKQFPQVALFGQDKLV